MKIIKTVISVIAIVVCSRSAACAFIEKLADTPLGRLCIAEHARKAVKGLFRSERILDKAYDVEEYFALEEEYSHYAEDPAWLNDPWPNFTDEPEEDCQILFTAPLDEEDVESLEEKRERMLRKYDVLYGENLSEYDFEGPVFGKDRVAELAEKFYNAHRGSDYEDNYARGLVDKLLNFLEWTPRTEFTYGEVMQRLDY